jgi:hypothetical protein
MTALSRNKQILIGIVVLMCVGLLLTTPWLLPMAKEKPEQENDMTPAGESLPIYDEPLIETGTNNINGLTNENWFSESLEDDQLTFATELLGTNEFNTSDDEQREYGNGEDADTGEATPATDDVMSKEAGEEMPRDIEEADIIKLEDNTLYILNTYRGLILVDISAPDEPEILSRVPLFGYPVEMYIVEPKAYVILTHYYNAFLWAEDTAVAPEYRHGSEIVIIDISDHTKPEVQQYIELEGFITDTRRVGEVIYAVANNYDSYGYIDGTMIGTDMAILEGEDFGRGRAEEIDDTEENMAVEEEEGAKVEDEDDDEEEILLKEEQEPHGYEEQEGTIVVSINMENLNDIKEVAREWFPGSSNEIHVTEDAIFVAKPEYNYLRDDEFGWKDEYFTNVTYVDISDYHGEIKIRDTFKVDGYLQDRYQMDYYDGTFRIVTHFWGEWGELGESKLWIFDTSNPDQISKLGELLIDDAGSLMATRFAKDRAYTIHLPYSIDPLDVLDLSDPTKPVLTDVFEMPGWITHMEVRGLKIIALGVDDSSDRNKVAVSLFDVTEPYNAKMTDRVTIGEGYTWSSANWDPKALSVIDDQNLVLVPFDSYSYDELGRYESVSGLQIVEFNLETGELTAGGAIAQIGSVQRTRATTERIFAISTQLLQVIDATNRAQPKVTATLELSNNIVDIIPMGDYCVQIINDNYYYKGTLQTKLRTVPATEPDTTNYEVEITVKYSISKIFIYNEFLYLICTEYSYEDNTVEGRILIYDYSDPLLPELKSDFLMDYYKGGYYGYYNSWYYGIRTPITDFNFCQVDGDIIVYHPSPEWDYRYFYEEVEVYDNSETNNVKEEEERSNGSSDSGTDEPPKERNETAQEKPPDEPVKYVEERTLTEILYIIDLSNPEEPKDAANITLQNTSQISGLHSNGKILYFTQREDFSGYDENGQWDYIVKNHITKVDLTNPWAPSLLGPINIPGEFLGVNDAGSVIYTQSGEYDENYHWHQTLNVLELNNDKAVLVSALDLGNNYADIIIQDSTIFLGYETYYYYTGYYYEEGIKAIDVESSAPEPTEYQEPKIKTRLQIIDAQDPKNLKLKTTLGLLNYGSIQKVENNKLYIKLTEANGILLYDITNLASPAFLGYYPTHGWVYSIREDTSTGRIYLACGWYGVLMIDVTQ